MKEIVLVVGIQGSGKSTTVQPFIDKGYERLNRDQLGGSMGELLTRMSAILTAGKKSVILDNTFCTPEDRQPFVETAIRFGYKCRALVMDTSFEDAQYNVIQRMIQKGGKLLSPDEIKKSKEEWAVPPAALFSYRKKYVAPRTSEGYDTIEFIHFVRHPCVYKNKAIILDKDGTLTECISGGKFPCTASDVRLLGRDGERRKRIQEWKDKGYLILGVSNQSGIGKGDIDPAEAVRIFERTNKLVGHDIDWEYCPHRSPPAVFCYCRKPQSGLGVALIEKHKLDPSKTVMVGDMTTDKTFASRCGFKYVHADQFFA